MRRFVFAWNLCAGRIRMAAYAGFLPVPVFRRVLRSSHEPRSKTLLVRCFLETFALAEKWLVNSAKGHYNTNSVMKK
jgi:hypothetical protein